MSSVPADSSVAPYLSLSLSNLNMLVVGTSVSITYKITFAEESVSEKADRHESTFGIHTLDPSLPCTPQVSIYHYDNGVFNIGDWIELKFHVAYGNC